jgi:hypothetical protein
MFEIFDIVLPLGGVNSVAPLGIARSLRSILRAAFQFRFNAAVICLEQTPT